jgi:hypothetical protein
MNSKKTLPEFFPILPKQSRSSRLSGEPKMIITTRACPHCSFFLRQIGDDPEHVLCPNNYCPEKFSDCCPRCDSDKKEVRLVRVGLTAFTCQDCGQDWDNVKTPGLPSSSNLIVLRFPKLATGS